MGQRPSRSRLIRLLSALLAAMLSTSVLGAPVGRGLAQVDGCPEPNDDVSNACLLMSGSGIQSFIERPGDVDTYRIVIDEGTAQIELSLTDLPADYDLFLVDAIGGMYGQSVQDGTAAEQLRLTLVRGSYFVYVRADPGREVDATRPYTLFFVSTVTSIPMTAPTGVLPSSSRRVLLSDNFDNPANGFLPRSTTNPSLVDLGYADGEYNIRRTRTIDNGSQGVVLPGTYTDSTVAANVRMIGATPGRRIQFDCRRHDSQGPGRPFESWSYVFRIWPASREFEIRRKVANAETDLVRLRVSAAIRRDNEWNHFEFACMGQVITARANGEELGSAEDSTHAEGQLYIGTTSEVRLENLFVYGP